MNADLLWRSQVYKLMCVLIIKDIVSSFNAKDGARFLSCSANRLVYCADSKGREVTAVTVQHIDMKN